MQLHRNAKLGLSGRRELVRAIERGTSMKGAAAAFSVSPATAHRWWHAGARRVRGAPLAWLSAGSLVPAEAQPAACSRRARSRICEAGAAPAGGRVDRGRGRPSARDRWRTLKRNGSARAGRALPREAARRFEWPCPGDLLQVDTQAVRQVHPPGHAVTGDRTRTGAERRARVGWEFAHSIVDDHCRLAYTELHPDERAGTVVGFVERGTRVLRRPRDPAADGCISDNAWIYIKNRELAALLATTRSSIARSRRGRPQTQRQGRALPTDAQTRMGPRPALPLLNPPSPRPATLAQPLQRAAAPQRIGNQPPISRVRNLPGHDS